MEHEGQSFSQNNPAYAIQTKNLTKTFGNIIAVDNLSLNVPAYDTFALLGSNGAGKTTTIRLMNAIIRPTEGTAIVNGLDVRENPQIVKRITGFLPETPGLYDKLTASEFLDFIGGLYSVPQEILSPRIEELLDLFGLQERKHDRLEIFSTGMKKRILLSSTLIHDPPILFFDEPTSGLDPTAARMVKDLIKVLTKQANKTIFICSHNLDVVEELASTVGIMHDGRLLIVGTVQDILTHSATSTLEDAFIKLTGGRIIKDELLEWRGLTNNNTSTKEGKPKKRQWFRRS